MNCEWIGCAPNNFRPGRPVGYRPELIVIHVIVGPLVSADRWFNDPAALVSAHYGIGCDGRIHQYVGETDTAFHAGIAVNPECELVISRPHVNPNYYSIGIEHEGQPGDDWTDEQAAASAALISELAQRWHIPIDNKHVIQHQQIRASRTCPGGQQKVDVLIARALGQPLQLAPLPSAKAAPVPTPKAPPVPSAQTPPVPSAQAHQVASVQAPSVQPVSVDLNEVRTVTKVRVRRSAPSSGSPVVSVLQINAFFKPTGVVIGESLQGNPMWYRDADGNFIWAGGTDAPHPKT